MTFDELKDHVSNVEDMNHLSSVHFGCDCGCGGNYYTSAEWDFILSEGEKSQAILEEGGITFTKKKGAPRW